MSDKQKYREMAEEAWPSIYAAYKEWEHKNPIIEYQVCENKIWAYPYQEYKKLLSEKDKTFLIEKYKDAVNEHKVIVFIRDNEKKRLVSTLFEFEGE